VPGLDNRGWPGCSTATRLEAGRFDQFNACECLKIGSGGGVGKASGIVHLSGDELLCVDDVGLVLWGRRVANLLVALFGDERLSDAGPPRGRNSGERATGRVALTGCTS
jgi:hypothetical protein